MFASYVSHHGHAFIDRALYLPKEWTGGPERLKAAQVPDEVGFATKPRIARRMIARAVAAKVPFSFVAADSAYGTGEIGTALRKTGKAGKGHVLGVASNHVFRSRGKKQLVGGAAAKVAQIFPKTPSGDDRRAKEPKTRACMTGPISNWPISMPVHTTAPSPESGRGVS